MSWEQDSAPYVNAMLEAYPTDAQQLVKELVDEGWVDRFRATVTPHDTWDVAVDLAKRLYPDNSEQEYEDIREAGHQGGDPRDTDNDTMSDSRNNSGEGDAGDPQEGTPTAGSSSEGDGEEQCAGEGETISWKDCVISEHNDWSPIEGEAGRLGITWEGRIPQGGVRLMPSSMVNVVDLDKSQASTERGGWHHRVSWQDFMGTSTENRQFANRIRRYIQARLDKGSIVRLGMPPIDGGEWNSRIFYDQRRHTMKDTAIFVLVDWSGSMYGRKMKYAADAAQRLVHTFERVLKVPVGLAAFSNKRSKCDIGYIKPWNSRGMTEQRIAEHFAKFESYSSGNNDADSVHWAYREILKRKEHRKILIVLSDGAPTGSFGGNSDDALRHVTNLIEKEHKVELYGVGICSNAVERYYSNHKVINNPSEINTTLFNLLKEGDNA